MLFRVDPSTGIRTIVSDFNDATQGQVGGTTLDVAVEPNGNILVTDLQPSGVLPRGVPFRVNPSTGARTILSDFGNLGQGPKGAAPCDVVVYAICGDGNPDPFEECDDGNTLNGDGCSATCKVEAGFVACSKRIANMVGTSGNDIIVGTDGGDVIAGLGGDDMIFASAGKDVVCEGSGNDFIEGASNNQLVREHLQRPLSLAPADVWP